MSNKQPKETTSPANNSRNKKAKCGIIMPIADNPDLGYPLGHWTQVREIIIDAAKSVGFDADMVSNDNQVDIIHSTIIKNIYANDVAVCDVSTRNANVMFELGLRIASKKPVILIKDETTPYSFDTQLIPHIGYRRDLRLFETLSFQKELSEKMLTAYNESQQPNYKSFLGQFTSYTLAQIDEQQVGVSEYFAQVANRMQTLEDTIKSLSTAVNNQNKYMMIPNNIEASSFWAPTPQPQRKLAIPKSFDSFMFDYLKTAGTTIPSKLSKAQKSEMLNLIRSYDFPETRNSTQTEIMKIIEDWMPF